MKTKIIIGSVLAGVLLFASCKKEEEQPGNPVDNSPTLSTNLLTIMINDTVDFNSVSSCSDMSIGLDKDSIHTDLATLPEYAISSIDSGCFFTGSPKNLRFFASNDAFMITNYAVTLPSGLAPKKFSVGDIVSYSTSDGASVSTGSARTNILIDGGNTGFSQNSTAYLGLIFSRGSDNYHGWLKIKLLNDYSCVLESYTVSQDANLAVKIQ